MDLASGRPELVRRLPPVATPIAAPPSGPPRETLPLALERLYAQLEVPEACWGYPSGAVIAFAHGTLKVPAGMKIADDLRLLPFQVEFIRDVYDVRHADGRRKRRQAVLSVSRRNGKSLTSAVLGLAHLAGPLRRRNSTIHVAATSREQAEVCYRYTRDMVQASPALGEAVKVIDSRKRILHRDNGSLLATVSSDVKSKFGTGIDVAIVDECAQHRTDELFVALKTSQSAQVEPLTILLGTQADSDEHWYSQILDDGLRIRAGEFEDVSLTVHLHAADDGSDLLDETQWRKANPALGIYRDEQELRDTMAQAVRVPSHESRTRNLYLNQRVSPVAPFLSPAVWKLGQEEPDEALLYDGRPVYGGLDLSTGIDLTSLVLAVTDDLDRTHLFQTSWTPADTLDQRAARDRAPYRAFVRAGRLVAVPGAAINYDFVAREIGEVLMGGVAIHFINADPYKLKFLKESMARLGVDVELKDFRQGFLTYASAVDAFEAAALDGKLVHGGDPVLTMAIANVKTEIDAAGNRKPTKKRSTGRIDPAVAAIMGVAAARLRDEPELDVSTMIVA